jgi:hypothetical protein
MEPIERLPPPLKQIEIPLYLSVTRLASAGPCLLRAVDPPSDIPHRPSSPRAEFGKLIHSLIDLAGSGRLGTDDIPEEIEQAFDHLLAQTSRRLFDEQATRRYADLRVAFTNREWEKRRFLAISAAQAFAKKRTPIQRPRSNAALSLESVLKSTLRTAAEIPFQSAALRIRGRLDLVDIENPRDVTISDYKSGVVANSDGVVDEQTCLQLRLYGLAAAELDSGKQISLRVISRGGEFSVSFDEAEQRAAFEWLMGTIDRLPAGQRIDAAELAVMGKQCRTCEVRPVCPLYRGAVRDLWAKSDNEFQLPLDIAGNFVACEPQDNAYVSLKMTDLGGRTVKLHRLLPRLFPSASTDVLWFFDLASIEATRRAGWRHPRNFHEIATTTGEQTAWTLRIFSSENQL